MSEMAFQSKEEEEKHLLYVEIDRLLVEVERLRGALRGALGAWDQHHHATPETEHHQIRLALK